MACDGEKSSEVTCTQATPKEKHDADGTTLLVNACAKEPNCSATATTIMNIADFVEGVGKTFDKLSYYGIGSQGAVCGGADAIVGGDLCISGQVMINPRAGQIGAFVTTSLVPRIGIPNIASGSTSGGPIVALGVSDLFKLTGLSRIVGIDVGANAGPGLGVAGQRSDSLNELGQPVLDPVTGMPVTTYAAGPQASVNVLPTAIDGSIKAGNSYTHGCVLSFSPLDFGCR